MYNSSTSHSHAQNIDPWSPQVQQTTASSTPSSPIFRTAVFQEQRSMLHEKVVRSNCPIISEHQIHYEEKKEHDSQEKLYHPQEWGSQASSCSTDQGEAPFHGNGSSGVSPRHENYGATCSSPLVEPRSVADANSWKQRILGKLYGRDTEQATLIHAFEMNRHRSQDDSSNSSLSSSSFVLMTGPMGIGKTYLVETALSNHVQEAGGFFVSGKFDLLQRAEPFTGFVAALTEFALQLLHREPDVAWRVRDEIFRTVGAAGVTTLIDAIPGLRQLLGEIPSVLDVATGSPPTKNQSEYSDSKPEMNVQRFLFCFRMLMKAVCSEENPILLLLDDLQYADACSLDLLNYIIQDENEGLLIVGTADDNLHGGCQATQSEVCASCRCEHTSNFQTFLRQQDERKLPVTNIQLRPLTFDSVRQLIMDAFEVDEQGQHLDSLVKVIYNRANGNPFLLICFVEYIVRDLELVYLEQGKWKWDEEEIQVSIPDSQVEPYASSKCCARIICPFVNKKLDRIENTNLKELLKVASCIGHSIDEWLLKHLLPGYAAESLLESAAGEGLLVRKSGSHHRAGSCYTFSHDFIQQAALELTINSEREKFHYDLGKKLWLTLDERGLDRNIYTVLAQLQIGRRNISKQNDRLAVANLCLYAARKAVKSSAFKTASTYLRFGMDLLNVRSWRENYDLTLTLHNTAAEIEMCCARYERTHEIIDKIYRNARSFDDKLCARKTEIYTLGVSDRGHEAIARGLTLLEELGESFPRRFNKAYLAVLFLGIKRMLRGKSDQQILRMPDITDEKILTKLQIIMLLGAHCMLLRPDLSSILLLKAFKVTLVHGLSVIAGISFAAYGVVCINASKDFEEGHRFGQLALTVLEKYGATEYLPRVYTLVYGMIFSWTRPIRETLEPLERGHRIGMQTGDVQYACHCSNMRLYNGLAAGIPLNECLAYWKRARDVYLSGRQDFTIGVALVRVQFIQCLMGKSSDCLPGHLTVFDDDQAMNEAVQAKATTRVIFLKFYRLQRAYIFNEIDEAARWISVVNDIKKTTPSLDIARICFFGGLVALRLVRNGTQTRKNVRLGKRMLKMSSQFAKSCPYNCLMYAELLEAELASVLGKHDTAYAGYVKAAAIAKQGAFLCEQALSNELAARHLLALGDAASAAPFFRQAIESYQCWGALAKVDRLEAEVRQWYETCQ